MRSPEGGDDDKLDAEVGMCGFEGAGDEGALEAGEEAAACGGGPEGSWGGGCGMDAPGDDSRESLTAGHAQATALARVGMANYLRGIAPVPMVLSRRMATTGAFTGLVTVLSSVATSSTELTR